MLFIPPGTYWNEDLHLSLRFNRCLSSADSITWGRVKQWLCTRNHCFTGPHLRLTTVSLSLSTSLQWNWTNILPKWKKKTETSVSTRRWTRFFVIIYPYGTRKIRSSIDHFKGISLLKSHMLCSVHRELLEI